MMTAARSIASVAATAVAAVLVSSVAIASATGLGGIDTASLWSWNQGVTVEVPDPEQPPDPIALRCDTFEGTSGPLDGRIPSCGGSAWSTVGRPWNVAGGRVNVNGGSGSSATLEAGARDVSVGVTVFDVDQSNRTGGVIMASAGGNNHLAVLLTARTAVELRLGDGTVLATATAARSTATRLVVELVGNDVQVVVDGVVVISGTYPLAGLGGTRVGLAHGGGPTVGFTDFTVTAPGPP